MFSIMGRPWDVYLATNQLANRAVMDTVSTGGKMLVARNKNERIEKCISLGGYWLSSLILPTILELFINKRYKARYRTAKQGNPIALPFEALEENAVKAIIANPTDKVLAKYGLSAEKLKKDFGLAKVTDFNHTLVKKVRRVKLAIMAVDFAFVATKGALLYRFRNWYTAKTSGKKGFVGEFNYTNEAFRKKQEDDFNKAEAKRQKRLISNISTFTGAILAPVLMAATLKSTAVKGPIGFIKKHLPKFNYTDAIFMSRWLIFWQAAFSYEVPKLMAARDSHEFRESLVDLGMFNFLYFGGDALISGLLAQRVMRKKGLEGMKGVSLTKPVKIFGRQFQAAVPYQEIYKQVSGSKHPAFKAARNIFFVGLLGSATALALFNMANYTFTRLKAEKQQAIFNRNLIQPLLTLMDKPPNSRVYGQASV